MEQQQLPLIETSDRATGTADAVSADADTSATTATSGTSSRRARRKVGSTRPPSGTPGTDWRLDEHTRAVGRQGVAAARALLNRNNRAA
jgi:hypothetical protein